MSINSQSKITEVLRAFKFNFYFLSLTIIIKIIEYLLTKASEIKAPVLQDVLYETSNNDGTCVRYTTGPIMSLIINC